jgi:hypothetical protein
MLHSKGFELGFLKGLISGRKKLKKTVSLVRGGEADSNSLAFTEKKRLSDGILVDSEHDLKVVTEIPKLFKIPFWLVSLPNQQTVSVWMTVVLFEREWGQ